MSTTPATAHATSFSSSPKRTRPMSIITHEAAKTSTADEVWAGKITAHDTTTGISTGHVPSRQMRPWAGSLHQVQKRHEGTMHSLSIFDCRPAS